MIQNAVAVAKYQMRCSLRLSLSWHRKCKARAFGAEVPAAWVTADEVYGGDRRLRLWLEAQQQAYLMAVSTLEVIEIDARNAQSRSASNHC